MKDLIKKYEDKIKVLDSNIEKINTMILNAKNGESTSDVEDLNYEKDHAQHDKILYKAFIQDLKNVN